MEMTFNQYVDSLFECVETAIYNYDIEVMVEAADGEDPEKSPEKFEKLKSIGRGAAAVANKIWQALLELCRKIKSLLLGKQDPFRIEEDINIYPGALKFDAKLCLMADKIANGDVSDAKNIIAYCQSIERSMTLRKGAVVASKTVIDIVSKYEQAIKKLASSKPAGDTSVAIAMNSGLNKSISKILGGYLADANKLITMAKNQEEKAKADLEAKNESIDISALRATLLSEAARLLDEDAACYVDGIDGGDVLSNGLPSEKPVVDDEYPADDVTGGYGDGTDEDAIENLVADDKDALDILKVDKGSVDPTVPVTESVVIRF